MQTPQTLRILFYPLQAVHARFYLSDVPLAVGLVGPGLIGKTLLAQIKAQVQSHTN